MIFADAAIAEIDLPTVLLAKSEADEVIEEVFLAFPIIVAGGLTSAFVVQYIKNLKPLSEDGLLTKLASDAPLPELPELPNIDLPEPVTEYGSLVAVPAFTVVFFLAAKAGFLGTFAGLAAKTSFDAWNIFAQIVLPGAILKY